MILDFKLLEIASKPLWALGSFLIKKQENLKFFRDEKFFGDYNRFYGPTFFEKPKYCYAYLVIRLINEGPKILLREVKTSIFSVGDQKNIKCDILETPPTTDKGLGKIHASLHQFPESFELIGLPNKMEILSESCRDYFMALRCIGFETNNVEGRDLESFQDEFSTHVGFDVTLEFITSRNKRFVFKTTVWSVDPAERDPKKELKI